MNILMKDKPFGKITSISGMNITIEIEQKLLDSNLEQEIVIDDDVLKFYIGTVGDLFLIGGPTTDDNIHYGIFEEIRLVTPMEGAQIKRSDSIKAVISAKVIGYQDPFEKGKLKFRRGAGHYPKFNAKCFLLSSKEKKELFFIDNDEGINIGKTSGVQDEPVNININKFLGKHSVILGSTGAGKSCTVASIMQKILKTHSYSHIVFFDLHNEYYKAFIFEDSPFKVNLVEANKLQLPYWFLSFEEFQSIYLGDIDYYKNSDGIRKLKEIIIKLKEEEHKEIENEVGAIERINVNVPLYYSFDKLLNELEKINAATFWKSDGEPAIDSETGNYLKSTGSGKINRPGKTEKDSVNNAPSYNTLTQIIEKLISIKNDRRYQFLFPAGFEVSTSIYKYSSDLLSINTSEDLQQMSILDFSKIPSEITPIITGIFARICFEYKLWDKNPKDLPLYLVFEEAHNYIPKDTTPVTKLTKKYIGRIAKEGRKYGISQLVISQRPSDLCDTIVSQCSNFFVLRVTNPNDQSFVQKVLPDHLVALSNMIPFFENGECLVAGECVKIPTKVIIDPPNPDPDSDDVLFSNKWKEELKDYKVEETIHRWWDVADNG